jgi:hypothetical protein
VVRIELPLDFSLHRDDQIITKSAQRTPPPLSDSGKGGASANGGPGGLKTFVIPVKRGIQRCLVYLSEAGRLVYDGPSGLNTGDFFFPIEMTNRGRDKELVG